MSNLIAKSQIFRVSELQASDFVDPKLFTHATAVELSMCILTCCPRRSLVNDLMAKYTAFKAPAGLCV